MHDDVLVFCGLHLEQLLDHHHTLPDHSLCEKQENKRFEKSPSGPMWHQCGAEFSYRSFNSNDPQYLILQVITFFPECFNVAFEILVTHDSIINSEVGNFIPFFVIFVTAILSFILDIYFNEMNPGFAKVKLLCYMCNLVFNSNTFNITRGQYRK